MKTKQRFKTRTAQPMKVDLSKVSTNELFEELIIRAMTTQPSVCYFIDSKYDGGWNLHTAGNDRNPIAELTRLK